MFFAGYVVLQFVVLATAWNILGGYAGYVNFGSGAFFAVGAYTSVALIQAFAAPLLVQVIAAAAVTGAMGFLVGVADAAPARHLLLDRHGCHRCHLRDGRDQLGIRRRRTGYRAAPAAASRRVCLLQSHAVRGDGLFRRTGGWHGALRRDLLDRARVACDPRERGGRRVGGRAHAEAQAGGGDPVRSVDGRGRCAVSRCTRASSSRFRPSA